MEPTWDGGTKICSNDPGHMTKWLPCPYMVKTFYSETKMPMSLKVGMQHRVLEYYSELTLTYFTARSNLVPYAFICEKGKNGFSETIFRL